MKIKNPNYPAPAWLNQANADLLRGLVENQAPASWEFVTFEQIRENVSELENATDGQIAHLVGLAGFEVLPD